jgi:hypothetical protein
MAYVKTNLKYLKRFSALQIIIKTFFRQYTDIIVQIGRRASKCKFNVSGGHNICPRNKRIFHIKTFVEPL